MTNHIAQGGQGHSDDDVLLAGKGCGLLLALGACTLVIAIMIYGLMRLGE